MKNVMGLLGLSLLLLAHARASSLPVEVIENMDQRVVVLYLGEQQITDIPAWSPGEGKPPMSVAEAVERALAWASKETSLADAHIHEIEFKPIHHYEKLNRWYYLVELRLPDASKRFLAVLPDGTVVPAIEEPGI